MQPMPHMPVYHLERQKKFSQTTSDLQSFLVDSLTD